jgi:hypothetical protein
MSERGFVRDYGELVVRPAGEIVINRGIQPPLRLDCHIAQ